MTSLTFILISEIFLLQLHRSHLNYPPTHIALQENFSFRNWFSFTLRGNSSISQQTRSEVELTESKARVELMEEWNKNFMELAENVKKEFFYYFFFSRSVVLRTVFVSDVIHVKYIHGYAWKVLVKLLLSHLTLASIPKRSRGFKQRAIGMAILPWSGTSGKIERLRAKQTDCKSSTWNFIVAAHSATFVIEAHT